MKRVLLLVIVLAAAASAASAQSLDALDSSLTKIDQQRAVLIRDYDREKKQNDERRKRMESGAASESDTRLAYMSAARLDAMNAQLNGLNAQKQELCAQWRVVYRSTVDHLLAGAEKETDRKKKAEAGRRLQQLQGRNAQLCAESLGSGSLEWGALQIEEYDGPQEIAQKTQLLKDIQREMTLRLGRLDDLYRQAQKERRTRERAREFIQEGTLFDQVVSIRSPGSVDSAARPNPGALSTENATDTGSVSPGAGRDPAADWQFSDNPKKAEEDYRKKRDELLRQQKELEKKIKVFEEKAHSLLHP